MTTTHTGTFAAEIPVAPIDPAALERSLLPFGRSTMLPAEAYTSETVLAWERRHLFAGTWACLGRLSDLRGAGLTQRAVTVGDVPVLLTFGPETDRIPSGVRALANTCRHRGHELLPDGGGATRQSIVCPYHAWSFSLDGSLRAAPGFRENEFFVADEQGLLELPLEVWQGWVFVNATGTAVPFAEHQGGLLGLVDPYQPGRLVERGRHSYEIQANWKVVVENYHECYHCPLIHPELCAVSEPTSGDNYDLPGAWVGGSMDLRDGMATMSLSGESGGLAIPGVDPKKVLYLGLTPNLLISPHPDYVMTHRLVPLAPDRTWVECMWLFPETPEGEATIDPAYAIDFWDITNREDWGACESVQRGLASPHFRPGPLAPNEDAVHQFVTMIGRAYQGVPPHLPTPGGD